jgi:hypothetical protein
MKTLTEDDFERAARTLLCDVPAIKAVCEVEAPDGGFLPDGQVTILFERHQFSKRTGRRFDSTNPDISNPMAGGYGPKGQHQHDRLEKAVTLDRNAALASTSWGKFQIMGFNYGLAGFATLQAFITAMHESEGAQLDAFINYVKNAALADELRQHRWADFARGFNGPDYAKNRYDTKLAAAYRKWGGA